MKLIIQVIVSKGKKSMERNVEAGEVISICNRLIWPGCWSQGKPSLGAGIWLRYKGWVGCVKQRRKGALQSEHQSQKQKWMKETGLLGKHASFRARQATWGGVRPWGAGLCRPCLSFFFILGLKYISCSVDYVFGNLEFIGV